MICKKKCLQIEKQNLDLEKRVHVDYDENF